MLDNLTNKYARLLVQHSLKVAPRDLVIIEGSEDAIPLLRELYRQVLLAGGNPSIHVVPSGLNYILHKDGQESQLTFVDPVRQSMVEKMDGYLRIYSSVNPSELDTIPQARQQLRLQAEGQIYQTFLRRTMEGLKWCVGLWPTNGNAQAARMSLERYTEIFSQAAFLDSPNPIQEYHKLTAYNQEIIQRVASAEKLRIIGPGTDLTLSVKGRTWVDCSGQYDIPDGEIYTSPVENLTEGKIHIPAVMPTYDDFTLEFHQGQVVDCQTRGTVRVINRTLETPGGRCLGEVAFGTNTGMTGFTGNILFDEKVAGTIHLALGASLPQAGGQNQSAVHMDMVVDLRQQGQIFADERLIFENGSFLI